MEERLRARRDGETLGAAKAMGFADAAIATVWETTAEEVRAMRGRLGIQPVYKMVDTCAAEFPALTPYYYSTYAQADEVPAGAGERVLVPGSGPIRIGQGIECDYSSGPG